MTPAHPPVHPPMHSPEHSPEHSPTHPPVHPRVHHVALADAVAEPWRNGGGLTRTLLTWPLDTADWLVRVSVATIARSGPFSRFDGVSRAFTVLRGTGVTLHMPDPSLDPALTPVRLQRGDAPLHFDGADAPACALLDGPTDDLNLMVQRRAGRARMVPATPGAPQLGMPRWRGLYTTAPVQLWVDGVEAVQLPADSLAWSADPSAATWALGSTSPTGVAWWLSLETA